MQEQDYSKICFVAMPFNIKQVGDKDVDFDYIYSNIFAPAIANTPLPEGGYLVPKRADEDFFSGSIDVEMFQYLEYSRLTLADISGLNANVFYELGVRHRAHAAGTVIFRQVTAPIPFDVNHIKAFPYEYEPEAQIAESRAVVTRALTESLINNRLDSPVQIALAAQRALSDGGVDKLLKEAENEIRHNNLPQAIVKYLRAIRINPTNPTLRLEVGLLYKDMGDWRKAAEAFLEATHLAPTYSAAQRELGIAQNKLYQRADATDMLPTGEAALREAISLDDQDFDAYASLGGILKRLQRHGDALTMYQQATTVSQGHPYPLLNTIKLQVWRDGVVQLTPKQLSQLKRAERMVRAQTQDNPPFDAPWCFFDLSDINFFLNRTEPCIEALQEGIYSCTHAWQAQTHLASMSLMISALEQDDTFRRAISLLEEEIPHLPGYGE